MLVLVKRTGAVKEYPISVRIPVPISRIEMSGYEFSGRIAWILVEDRASGKLYGSGLLNLATGKESSSPQLWPSRGQRYTYLSPDDTLFSTFSDASSNADASMTISRWSGDTLVPLGKIAPINIIGIQNDGVVWGYVSVGPQTYYLRREAPDSQVVRSWMIRGDIIGGGPGYVAYIPDLHPHSVAIFFPEQHRTLRFSGLNDPWPLRTMIAHQVALIGTGRQWNFDPSMHVIVAGHGRKIEAIEVSSGQ
jgi:hypothetical protein